jgi:hypothetical protein
VDLGAMRLQDLPDQQAELPIAQHCHWCTVRDSNLVQDFASSSKRLDENRVLGRDLARHYVQIRFRQRQEFAKRAGVFHDPEHFTF